MFRPKQKLKYGGVNRHICLADFICLWQKWDKIILKGRRYIK